MNTTTLKPSGRHAAQVARDVISLFKLRIGVLIMVTALVGMAVSPGPAPGLAQVLVLALSVLIASASAALIHLWRATEPTSASRIRSGELARRDLRARGFANRSVVLDGRKLELVTQRRVIRETHYDV